MKLIAKDLMVGDWIQMVSDAPTMPNEYHQIDWIRTGEIGLDNRKIVTYPYIQPIPLTPEILEKNGFVNMGFFGKLEIGKFVVICDTNNLTILRDGHCDLEIPIHFVHELQHALLLCGIEKEIVL